MSEATKALIEAAREALAVIEKGGGAFDTFEAWEAAEQSAIRALRSALHHEDEAQRAEGECFECGAELHAPFCPACNPEMVRPSGSSVAESGSSASTGATERQHSDGDGGLYQAAGALGPDLQYLHAALSWYDGTEAGLDVRAAWLRVVRAMGFLPPAPAASGASSPAEGRAGNRLKMNNEPAPSYPSKEEIARVIYEAGVGVKMPNSRSRFINADDAAERILALFPSPTQEPKT